MDKITMSEEFFEKNFRPETRAKYTLEQMNELFDRLTVLTNIAFVLSDVVHTFFMDADDVFKKARFEDITEGHGIFSPFII